jgi:hypothetical protein
MLETILTLNIELYRTCELYVPKIDQFYLLITFKMENNNMKSIRIFSLFFSLVANINESFGTTTYISVSSRDTQYMHNVLTWIFTLCYGTECVYMFQSKGVIIREQVTNNIA